MIIENMRHLHPDSEMVKLTGEQNRLHRKLQQQILDMADFTNGTLFKKIIEINKQMTEKLETRIDLRMENNQPAEDDAEKEDQMKMVQEKLDRYVQEFAILNVNNKRILAETHEKLDADYQHKLLKFDESVKQGMNAMRKHVDDDKARQEGHKNELN